jgi:hypothetical protein
MPIYLGNTEIGSEYVDSYQLGNLYLGANKLQGNLTVLPIPTTNLIFNVDANSTASYPGSGSIWYNTATAGASTNVLFTGSVSYVTQSVGNTNYFQFNTASYYSTSNITSTTTSRTMGGWFWVDNTDTMNWLNYGRGTGFTDLGNSNVWTGGNLGYFNGSNFLPNVSGSITTGRWYNIMGVGIEQGSGNDSLYLFINGVLVNQTLNNATLTDRNNRAVYSEGNLFGRAGMMSIYSAALDYPDIASYFNNTKELFGY